MSDDDYVYDEASGEWLPAAPAAPPASEAVEVRDAVGNRPGRRRPGHLDQGSGGQGRGPDAQARHADQVDPPATRRGRDPQEIDCKYDGIKGLVLRAEFVRKR